MMYRKVVYDGYILGVGQTTTAGNIDEAEYTRLTGIFSAMPEAPDGFNYMLREDETWELVKKDPEPEFPDIDDSEALEIILGGAE